MAAFDAKYRGFWVWGAGTVLVLGSFLIFVLAGWPGDVNSCIWGDAGAPKNASQLLTPPPRNASKSQAAAYQNTLATIKKNNTCYCEDFSVPDAVSGASGTRQGVNTWFNLYSIGTSFVVAFGIYLSRRDGSSKLIGSSGLIPDAYIFAVLFLGLGSMWFHGAMKEWGGITDTLSMYLFAAFLVFFTIRRRWDSDLFFWLAYLGTAIGLTILGEVLAQATNSSLISLFLILSLVAAYAALEFRLWSKDGTGSSSQNWWNHFKWWGDDLDTSWRWWAAVGSILAASAFWKLSQTGQPLCSPGKFFQPHGLLWHPLAGVMAVFLYFYWRWDIPDTP
jgi:hypothetical protein